MDRPNENWRGPASPRHSRERSAGALRRKANPMSFASSLASPAVNGLRSVGGAIASPGLRAMAKTVGVILGAGILAAGHQIAYEEGRSLIHAIQVNGGRRRHLNTQMTLALVNSGLPLPLQDKLRRSRNAVNSGLAMLTDEKNPLLPDHHAILRSTIAQVTQGDFPTE